MKSINLIFLTAIISGFSIFINKFGVDINNPFLFTFIKNSLTFVMVFGAILLLSELRDFKKVKIGDWKRLAAIGLIGGSIPFLLFFRGLQLTNAAKGSFIHKTMFIYVALLAYFFLKERFNWKFFTAAGLLIVGNALLLKLSWQPLNIGDMMIFAATLFWAVENVISKQALKDIPPKIVAFSRMFFGSIFILAFLVATGDINGITTMTQQQWLWSIVPSILLTLYVLTWYSGLKDVYATTATAILLLGSPITTMLNFMYAGTPIILSQAIGIVMLLVGVVGVTYIAQQTEPRKTRSVA
ncbi:MAG: DMT family transporter [Candidatus Woesearchaeota archaeon]|nr:DMT family transporter [Candidatus Woesearchaeota archaeon]